jgi:hypothetical protein
VIDRLRELFSPEERRVIGQEAKQLLANPHFKQAWEAVDGYLNEVALSCDPDNKDKAQRVIVSKQLLAAVKREVVRKIEDGEMAEIEIAELEARKRPLRFVR